MKKMMKSVTLTVLFNLISGSAVAQSAKFSANTANIAILDSAQQNWSTILSTQIRTSSQKELQFGVSLECGLYNKTTVRSKTGTTDTSSADAKVSVRVLIDGRILAAPGVITFCERQQQLSATLGGIIDSCRDSNLDGTIDFVSECIVREEEISLVQRTMGAHHFNMMSYNMGSGLHKVEVQAKIETKSGAQLGEAAARASIGKGSLTVEEVRAVRGEMNF